MESKPENLLARSVAGLTTEDASCFGDILARLKEATSTNSDAELSLILGLKSSAVSTAKGRGIIPPAWIINIANTYKVSADWLAFGGGFKPEPQGRTQPFFQYDYVKVPRVATELAAGAGSFIDSTELVEELAFRRDWLASKGQLKDLVVMTVWGDSMEPTLKNKDFALINLAQTQVYNSCIYAIAHDESLYVKRLLVEPGRLILRSDNKNYPDIVLNYDDQATMDKVKIIGRVIWWCHDDGF
jgi:phage repressor protein C with HTH and peptisase S24 domain